MKENKEKYDPVKYARKYDKEHYKLINFSVSIDFYNRVSTYAASIGENKASFIKRCIKETIERDKKYGKTRG